MGLRHPKRNGLTCRKLKYLRRNWKWSFVPISQDITMNLRKVGLLAAAALCAASLITPLFAADIPTTTTVSVSVGGVVGGKGRGAPGPIAGVGLPFLIAAGGISVYRRVRRRGDESRREHQQARHM